MKILVANGVNLDLLGTREPEIYGQHTLKDVEHLVRQTGETLAKVFGIEEIHWEFLQSNDEAEFLRVIATCGADGAIINAGAWSHYSYALADRLAALKLPFVEAHISNLSQREPWRHVSVLAPHASGVVYGLGLQSYAAALFSLLAVLTRPAPEHGI